jgi:macrolide transport system ATP-binding/permease protein
MFWLRLIYTRLYGLLHKNRIEQEMEEEIRFHLLMRTRENIERGMKPNEAEREARQRFGYVGHIKDLARDIKGGGFMETFLQDLRYGVRILLKNPWFTFVVVITAALGIGVNTSIFCLVDAALLRPLPVAKAPEELVVIRRVGGSFSYPDFRVLRERSEVLSGLALHLGTQISFGNGERSEVVRGSLVSANYFEVLGIKPVLGRTFLPEEDETPGAHPVVVLSHNFWQSRFNDDRAVIGRNIVLNNRRFTVVGVAAAGFNGEEPLMKVNFWIPVMMISSLVAITEENLRNPQFEIFGLIGRIKPGVSIVEAQAALETINRALDLTGAVSPGQGPNRPETRALRLISLRGITISNFREMAEKVSRLLTATTIIVLMIACANVANLLLARATTRRKEIAVRLALGATRLRLIRQLLTESVMLALIGAGAGLLFAYWINHVLRTFRPPLPSAFSATLDLPLDARAFGFALLLAVMTGGIFGLAPALRASRPDVVPALKDESGAQGLHLRRWNLRNALVVAQVALSLSLLIGTGLFLRSLQFVRQIDLGFKPDHVLAGMINAREQGYDEARGREFYRQIVARLEQLPGVQSASVTFVLPLSFFAPRTAVVPEGREIPQNEGIISGNFAVGPRYFETLGTPLIRGRDFTVRDTINSPQVAIVSEKLARRLWPEIKDSGEALGKRLRASGPNPITSEVVGVVKDSKNSAAIPLDQEPQPTLYRPFAQNYSPFASVVVRAGGDPRSLIAAVRREISALDENLPVQDLQPLTETISLASWSARTWAAVLSFFGFLGLALAGVGIYTLISFSVARRTREIGLRMALGAGARDILKLIIKQGLGVTLVGIFIGLGLAVALTRMLAGWLYGVSATDPATFAGTALFLLFIALLACYLPARRATKVDPMTTLRRE